MELTRRSFIKISCAFIGMGALDAKEAIAGLLPMAVHRQPSIMFYVI